MQFDDLLSKQNHFKIERMTYHKNVSMSSSHYHSHYEILYIESGSRTISLNETKHIELNQNTIALLPPNIIHATKSNSETQTRVLINISYDLINEIANFSSKHILAGFDTMFLPLSAYDIKIIKYHIQQLIDMQSSPANPLKPDNIKIALASLLMTLANINYDLLQNNETYKTQSQNFINMDSLIKFIGDHYYEDITLAELSQKAAMSEQHLIKTFTEKYQTTPIKYLNTFRIVTAQRLLESNTMNVTEVASSCGFNSNAHFSRTFKQIIGITPKEYQLKFKNNNK